MATITLYSVAKVNEKNINHFITGQIKKQIKSKLDDSIGEIADAVRPKANTIDLKDNPAIARLQTIHDTIQYAKDLGASRADRVFVWSTDRGVVDTINNNGAELQQIYSDLIEAKTDLGVRVGYQDPTKKNKFVDHANKELGIEIEQTSNNTNGSNPLEILNDVKQKVGYNDRQNS